MCKNAMTPEFIIYNEVNSSWRMRWGGKKEKQRENPASVKEFWMVQIVYMYLQIYISPSQKAVTQRPF